MSLSLRGWPPLASHAACLILGASLAHLAQRDAPPPLRLPARSVALGLPAGALRAGGAPLPRGTKVALVQGRTGGEACRILHGPAVLLEKQPAVVVGVELARLGELAAAAKGGHFATLSVSSEGAAGALPACRDGPKVTYGGG